MFKFKSSFYYLSQQNLPQPATTELTGGGSASSHSSIRIKSTPSARGIGHFILTEITGLGVAREMRERAGVTAKKDVQNQVRNRSPHPSQCVDCGICCLRGLAGVEVC